MSNETKPTPDLDHPRNTIIIAAEDGKYYKLTGSQWQEHGTPITPAEQGVVDQLIEWGSYLAFIPTDKYVGIGSVCTIVNLKSILQNNPSKDTEEGGGGQ